MSNYDLVIQNALVVRPGAQAPERLDVAVKDGSFAAFEERIDASEADEVLDAAGKQLSRVSSTCTSTGASTTSSARTRTPRAVRPRRAVSPPASPTCAPVPTT